MIRISCFFISMFVSISFSFAQTQYLFGYRGTIGADSVELYVDKYYNENNPHAIIRGYLIYPNNNYSTCLKLKENYEGVADLSLKAYPFDKDDDIEYLAGVFELNYDKSERYLSGTWEDKKTKRSLKVNLASIAVSQFSTPCNANVFELKGMSSTLKDLDKDGLEDNIQIVYDVIEGKHLHYLTITLSKGNNFYVFPLFRFVQSMPYSIAVNQGMLKVRVASETSNQLESTYHLKWNPAKKDLELVFYQVSYKNLDNTGIRKTLDFVQREATNEKIFPRNEQSSIIKSEKVSVNKAGISSNQFFRNLMDNFLVFEKELERSVYIDTLEGLSHLPKDVFIMPENRELGLYVLKQNNEVYIPKVGKYLLTNSKQSGRIRIDTNHAIFGTVYYFEEDIEIEMKIKNSYPTMVRTANKFGLERTIEVGQDTVVITSYLLGGKIIERRDVEN